MDKSAESIKITVNGFYFVGYGALITSTLQQVRAPFDFYFAGVSTSRRGSDPPKLGITAENSRETNLSLRN